MKAVERHMRSLVPSKDEVNSCVTTERSQGTPGREFKFRRADIQVTRSSPPSQGDTAGGAKQSMRFYYVRWEKSTGRALFQANCRIEAGEEALTAVVSRFSTGTTAESLRGEARRTAIEHQPSAAMEEPLLEPILEDGADASGGHDWIPDAPGSPELIGSLSADAVSGAFGMPTLALPGVAVLGEVAECWWTNNDLQIDCGELQCDLVSEGEYDCNNGCLLLDDYTEEAELETWYCWSEGEEYECTHDTELYDIHHYRWDCDWEYCGPSSGAPWWFEPPEECDEEEEEEEEEEPPEPCEEECEPPSVPEAIVFDCGSEFYLPGDGASCFLGLADLQDTLRLDSITWVYREWVSGDSTVGGIQVDTVDEQTMPYTPTDAGYLMTSFRYGGVRNYLWHPMTPRDSTIFDECDLAGFGADSLDFEEMDLQQPAPAVCEDSTSSAVLACLQGNPGFWVGSTQIVLGIHHTAFAEIPPTPVNISELYISGTHSEIHNGAVPALDSFPGYRWVRLNQPYNDTTRALVETGRVVAAMQYDERFYFTHLPPMSNVYVSTIVRRAGLSISKNERVAIRNSWGLCHCNRAYTCPG
jgi:hypothetical protein